VVIMDVAYVLMMCAVHVIFKMLKIRFQESFFLLLITFLNFPFLQLYYACKHVALK